MVVHHEDALLALGAMVDERGLDDFAFIAAYKIDMGPVFLQLHA